MAGPPAMRAKQRNARVSFQSQRQPIPPEPDFANIAQGDRLRNKIILVRMIIASRNPPDSSTVRPPLQLLIDPEWPPNQNHERQLKLHKAAYAAPPKPVVLKGDPTPIRPSPGNASWMIRHLQNGSARGAGWRMSHGSKSSTKIRRRSGELRTPEPDA